MAGFMLPSANIPAWAQNIPEDQWRHRILSKVTSPPSAKADKKTAHRDRKNGGEAADSCDKDKAVVTQEGTSCATSDSTSVDGT
jgi:hypothetical protein